jgi:PhzF family phenazine biosynthesis protein
MTTVPFFQVDAFADRPFAGGPAAVVLLDDFLSDERLLAIAAENNLAETAFLVPLLAGRWRLRWFTPTVEVPLCGHATLAASHVLFQSGGDVAGKVEFETASGQLTVEKMDNGWLEMDFPLLASRPVEVRRELCEALGARPIAARVGHYLLAQFSSPDEVRALRPDCERIAGLDPDGVAVPGCLICVAPTQDSAEGWDVVSRFFGPGAGVSEDPATGSAHCMIAPLYSELLGQDELVCHQAYPGRGAIIRTRVLGDRVRLAGQSVTVIEGRIRVG